jgi:putative ABC transport system substrate-binding protein
MKRREFITLLGGTAAWPLAARAQPTAKVWRVGMLDTTAATLNAANLDAFKQALRQLGYVEGQNLIVEYRSSDGHIERFPQLAAELVRLNVDIIITRGTPAALAAKEATATIPIVMAANGGPVETGMVASLARPGGNVTGLSAFVTELTAKRIEIMREVIPQLSRMAMIDNMANPAFRGGGTRRSGQRSRSASSRSSTMCAKQRTSSAHSARRLLSGSTRCRSVTTAWSSPTAFG